MAARKRITGKFWDSKKKYDKYFYEIIAQDAIGCASAPTLPCIERSARASLFRCARY